MGQKRGTLSPMAKSLTSTPRGSARKLPLLRSESSSPRKKRWSYAASHKLKFRVEAPVESPRNVSPRQQLSSPRKIPAVRKLSSPRSNGSSSGSGGFYSSKKSYSDREQEILAAAREFNTNFVSTVVDKMMVKGHMVMWCTAPPELKARYNCTDIKCIDTWMAQRRNMDMSMFHVGQKVKMYVSSVTTKGKHANTPVLRGVPCYKQDAQEMRA